MGLFGIGLQGIGQLAVEAREARVGDERREKLEPFAQEPHDGHDVVEWLAQQPFCDGKVAMWGGSYAGHDQWATAAQRGR